MERKMKSILQQRLDHGFHLFERIRCRLTRRRHPNARKLIDTAKPASTQPIYWTWAARPSIGRLPHRKGCGLVRAVSTLESGWKHAGAVDFLALVTGVGTNRSVEVETPQGDTLRTVGT